MLLYTCHAGLSCDLNNYLCNNLRNAFVERVGDDVFFIEFIFRNEGCKRGGCRNLHLVVNTGCAAVESSPENPRERENVVDLVREVGTACTHNARTGHLGFVRHNFRDGVSHRENDGILLHGANHILSNNAGSGNADKHIGSDKSVRKRSRLIRL